MTSKLKGERAADVLNDELGYYPPWGNCRILGDIFKNDQARYEKITGDYGSRYWTEIVQIVATLAASYAMVNQPNAGNAQFLQGISNALNSIQLTLGAVEAKIELVIDQLRAMEARIISAIERTQLRAFYQQAQYAGQSLQVWAKDPVSNLSMIQHAVYDLGKMLSVITSDPGQGADSFVVATPLVATWYQSYLLCEKTKQIINPQYVMQSVWAHGFNDSLRVRFASVFTSLKELDAIYQDKIIDRFTQKGYVLVLSGGRFCYRGRAGEISEIPPVNPAIPRIGDFQITCPRVVDDQIVSPAELFIYISPIGERWRKVTPQSGSANEVKAYMIFENQMTIEGYVAKFYQLMPEFYKQKNQVALCFNAPVGW